MSHDFPPFSGGKPSPSPGGIWSSGPLELGAEVARVPWRLLLTRATAMRSLGLTPELGTEVGEYPCIALQLIHETLGIFMIFRAEDHGYS